MSSEGDGAPNAPPGGGEPKAAPEKSEQVAAPNTVQRTLVGVPLLDDAGKSAPGTAVDVKAMSAAEAERVLAWTGFTQEEIPTVGTPLPSASPLVPHTSTLQGPEPSLSPVMADASSEVRSSGEGTTKHVSMPTRMGASGFVEPRGTTRGIAPPQLRTPMGGLGSPRVAPSVPPAKVPPKPKTSRPPPPSATPKGRSTLVMDAGAPPAPDESPTSNAMDRPPIVVPAAGALQPKAVTQPPPWGEGKMQVGVPRPPNVPRGREDSIEEISASVFLPEDEDLEKTRLRAPGAANARTPMGAGARPPVSDGVQELSGSVLLPEDSTSDLEKTRLRGPVVEELSGSILLPDDTGMARAQPALGRPSPAGSIPTQQGHAALPRTVPKTKESPVHPPFSSPSKPPPFPTSTSRPPPPLPHAAAPAHSAVPIPLTAPYAFPPQSAPPHAPAPAPSPAPAPIAAPVPAPHVPNRTMLGGLSAPPAAPVPQPGPSGPLPQFDMPIDMSPSADPSLPPGVPVPLPPPTIEHPAWPPPHVDDPYKKIAPSTPPPPMAAPPPSRMPSTPPPPHMSSAPPAPPRLESTDRFVRFLRRSDGLSAFLQSTGERFATKFPQIAILQTHPKLFLPIVAGAGFIVSIGLLGLLIAIFSGGSSDDPKDAAKRATGGAARTIATVAATFAGGSGTLGPAPTATSSTPTAPPAGPASTSACTVAGSAHVIAPRAIIAAGVEAVALEGGMAVGFAPTDREGMAVLLDPTSFAATSTAKTKLADTVRRVTPVLNGKKSLMAVADSDKKADRLRGRRYVAGDPAIDVGAAGGSLIATARGAAGGNKLWSLPGDGAVDAVRGVAFALDGEKAYAIAVRRGASIFVGVATGDGRTLAPKGGLSKLDGLGDKIGSPAIAVSGDSVLVAWADRRFDSDPWTLRYVAFKAGGDAGAPQSFSVPGGGLGANVMSPGVVGLAGNRFLLVWTEGPVDSHQVRAQTVRGDGSALGGALAISAEGVHAGQGQAAIGADGKGIVAFLDGAKREVDATPVACPP